MYVAVHRFPLGTGQSFALCMSRSRAGKVGSAVVPEARHLTLVPAWVSASTAVGGVAWLLVPALLTVGTFSHGLWVFNREAPRIAEEL